MCRKCAVSVFSIRALEETIWGAICLNWLSYIWACTVGRIPSYVGRPPAGRPTQCASVTNPVCSGKLTLSPPVLAQLGVAWALGDISLLFDYLGHGPDPMFHRTSFEFSGSVPTKTTIFRDLLVSRDTCVFPAWTSWTLELSATHCLGLNNN